MRRQGPNRSELHLARVLRSQQFLQRGRDRAKGSKTEQADCSYPVADRTLIVLSRVGGFVKENARLFDGFS